MPSVTINIIWAAKGAGAKLFQKHIFKLRMLKISGSLSKLECFQSLPDHPHWIQWDNSRRKGVLSRRQVALAKLSLATKIRMIDIKYYIKVKIVRRLSSSSSRDLEIQQGFWATNKLRVNKCFYTEKQSCNFSFSPSPLISGRKVQNAW